MYLKCTLVSTLLCPTNPTSTYNNTSRHSPLTLITHLIIILQASETLWTKILKTNVVSTCQLMNIVLHHMKAKKFVHIIL